MVEIPDDVAKAYAAAIRDRRPITWPDGLSREALADLLDPQPPSLRDQVSQTIFDTADGRSTQECADAVLAVVADAVKNHRHPDEPDFPSVWWTGYHDAQSDIERLLRGQS